MSFGSSLGVVHSRPFSAAHSQASPPGLSSLFPEFRCSSVHQCFLSRVMLSVPTSKNSPLSPEPQRHSPILHTSLKLWGGSRRPLKRASGPCTACVHCPRTVPTLSPQLCPRFLGGGLRDVLSSSPRSHCLGASCGAWALLRTLRVWCHCVWKAISATPSAQGPLESSVLAPSLCQ